MAGAGGGLGAWGPLMLLVLCSWTWARAAALNAVRNLAVGARTNSSISLVWEAPEGPDSQNLTYWVQCTGEGYSNETQNTTSTSATVDGLDAATSYVCSVWAEQDEVNGDKENLTVSTAPNAVRNLTVGARTNSSITLVWEAPEGPDSQNLTYWVQCTGEGYSNETQNTTSTSATVDGLDAATSYVCSVWAEQDEVNGDKENLTVSTAPNAVRNLTVEARTNSSISLVWEAPEGPDSQGLTYWVQCTREGYSNETQNTTSTSATVDGLDAGSTYELCVWVKKNGVNSSHETRKVTTVPGSVTIQSCVSTSGGYGVTLTWSCPPGGYEAFELQVGRQQLLQDRSACAKGVSVSGLQPARSYRASVTTLCDGLRAVSIPTTCHTESGGVIAGAIVGVLLLLVLVGLLVFFLRRRKRKSQEKAVPKDLVFSFPGDIPAEDFAHHVWRQGKDSNCGFAEEYQQLALEGRGQAQTVALAPENTTKNRYRNVLPYDWSRVPLKPLHGEPGSDYINASFLPGLCSPREFIAAQGPLPHTVGDFWRLVWEQQSHTLVMLTNCMESGRVKCEHYWPLDAQPCTHGRLRVALVAEEVAENWAVRDLELLQLDEQKTLSVRQFHYLAWPDHGVPHSPDPLLDFWRMLRQWLDQTGGRGPPIVHCSAGVGRTGTLIALDVLLRQLESEGLLGPFRFVQKMRESRPLMVQTEAQYVFLHQCILRFLQRSAQEEATYDHMPDPIYQNVAALQALEAEA